MSRQESSSFVEVVFDSLEFAYDGRKLVGELPIAVFDRLKKSLCSDQGTLQFNLQGQTEESASGGKTKPTLHLRVAGTLQMECQRCLQPMDVPLAINACLLLIAPGKPWPDDLEDETAEAIAADAAMLLKDLIEDEVLLALPIVPRHERCELPVDNGDKHATSPFAVLTQLKK